ncbi:hypothetical protein O1L60_01095 [Streptomyces diastatochromogenes]|nr:hypothetical protein [Streptomyces diastatochromogenes]
MYAEARTLVEAVLDLHPDLSWPCRPPSNEACSTCPSASTPTTPAAPRTRRPRRPPPLGPDRRHADPPGRGGRRRALTSAGLLAALRHVADRYDSPRHHDSGDDHDRPQATPVTV